MNFNNENTNQAEKETWIITGDEYDMMSQDDDGMEYDSVFLIRPFGASCSGSCPIHDFDGDMDEIENPDDDGDEVLFIHPDEHNYQCVECWRGATEEEAYIAFLEKSGIDVEKLA